MPTITLLVKAYGKIQLTYVDQLLKDILEGLEVKVEPCSITQRSWVQTAVSGEDETIALNYLEKEVGFCPAKLEATSRFSNVKGLTTGIEESKDTISVDIGIFSPETIDATISLSDLNAQLMDGRKTALPKVMKLYGFSNNLPLTIKIKEINREEKSVKAVLAEKQLVQYRNWTSSLLDRLIVLGAKLKEIEYALEKAHSERDAISVEKLGLFEHAVVCKLGTQAIGLIPRIGRHLQNASFVVFSPERILAFFRDKQNIT